MNLTGIFCITSIELLLFTYPWEQRKFKSLFQKNLERNDGQFPFNKTISISRMIYSESGNGANTESLDNYKVLRVGDIAFEGHENKDFKFGRFVMNDVGNGIMSPRFTVLRPLIDMELNFWKEYINYEPIMQKKLVYSTKKGTMMNELVIEDFLNQYVAVPLVQEQQKIGYLLKCMTDDITLHQRKLEHLKLKKKSLLQKLFPKEGEVYPELRFPGFTDPWEQRKLGDIATITGGGTPSTNISEYWNGDIDWYSPVEIGEKRYASGSIRKITKLGLEKSSAKILPVGTVLFTSRAGIGNTAILQVEGCTNQGFQSITPNSKELDTYFLYTMTPKLKRYGEVTGAGSTFVEVSGKQMEQMNLMIPSLDEQKHVSQLFKVMDDAITLHQRKLEHLQLLKKALLQQLFV